MGKPRPASTVAGAEDRSSHGEKATRRVRHTTCLRCPPTTVSRQPLDTTPASSLATAGVQVPTEPHLQGDPVADRIKIDEQNQHQVASFGIVSEEPGMERVHIPVDRAMSLLAEGKVPYRQPAPAPAVAVAPEDPFAEPGAPAGAAQEPADPFADPAEPAGAPAQP